MRTFLRTCAAGTAFALIAGGLALLTGIGLGPAQAATCHHSPVTDPMNVQVSPNANVHAFDKLKASFSGAVTYGHCAGDGFSFAIPHTLKAQDGASYPLKAPDGSLVATLVIHGGTATVTLTDYVEQHHNVTIQGFFYARIDASTAPGGTDDITWNVNGKTSTTPVTMSQCPNCTQLPTKARKSGTVIDGGIDIALNVAASTTADQVYAFTDTLTSPGQEFRCPVTAAKASIYRSRTVWGAPIYIGRVPVSISACSTGAITGSITIHAVGTAARIILPVAITDTSLTSWTDTASVTSNGVTQGTSTRVESFGGGGSGDGNNPTPSTSASASETSRAPGSGGSSGISASSVGRELPTAINGGGGPAASDDGTRVAGLSLIVGGLLGVGLLSWGVTRRRRAH